MRVRSNLALISLLAASSAHAVDGVLEINQTCVSVGCFAGDTAGFPVQITAPGSYRLTSNLTTPNQTVNAIEITASNTTIDLNGFGIIGINAFGGGVNGTCSASGSGSGVFTSNADGVVVKNGHIRGMGNHGIAVLANSRVKDVTAEQNCNSGITVGFGSSVVDSVARRNGGNGIVGDRASRVSDSVADFNGGNGIRNIDGDFLVESCTANANGGDGINVGVRSLVRGNTANVNNLMGIALSGAGLIMTNISAGNGGTGIRSYGVDPSGAGFNVAVDNQAAIYGVLNLACNIEEVVPGDPLSEYCPSHP